MLKNKKLLISLLVALFTFLLTFFGPYFFVKSLVGLDINNFDDNRLPPLNGIVILTNTHLKIGLKKILGKVMKLDIRTNLLILKILLKILSY